jgi:peroxiredoxin
MGNNQEHACSNGCTIDEKDKKIEDLSITCLSVATDLLIFVRNSKRIMTEKDVKQLTFLSEFLKEAAERNGF